MGYRSSVHAIFYWPNNPTIDSDADKTLRAEKYGLLKVLLNTTYKDLVDRWNEYENAFTFEDGQEIVEFRLDDTKWYDDYPEVKQFVEFQGALRDLGYAYEFIRIGEDEDDTEVERSPGSDCKLNLHRSTEIY